MSVDTKLVFTLVLALLAVAVLSPLVVGWVTSLTAGKVAEGGEGGW